LYQVHVCPLEAGQAQQLFSYVPTPELLSYRATRYVYKFFRQQSSLTS
jgi:hypothetical protein